MQSEAKARKKSSNGKVASDSDDAITLPIDDDDSSSSSPLPVGDHAPIKMKSMSMSSGDRAIDDHRWDGDSKRLFYVYVFGFLYHATVAMVSFLFILPGPSFEIHVTYTVEGSLARFISLPSIAPGVIPWCLHSGLAFFYLVAVLAYKRTLSETMRRRFNLVRWSASIFEYPLASLLIAVYSGIGDIYVIGILVAIEIVRVLHVALFELANAIAQPSPGSDEVVVVGGPLKPRVGKPLIHSYVLMSIPLVIVLLASTAILRRYAPNPIPDWQVIAILSTLIVREIQIVNTTLQQYGRSRWRNFAFGEKVAVWVSLAGYTVTSIAVSMSQ